MVTLLPSLSLAAHPQTHRIFFLHPLPVLLAFLHLLGTQKVFFLSFKNIVLFKPDEPQGSYGILAICLPSLKGKAQLGWLWSGPGL